MRLSKSTSFVFHEFVGNFNNETLYLQGFPNKKYHFHALLRINRCSQIVWTVGAEVKNGRAQGKGIGG